MSAPLVLQGLDGTGDLLVEHTCEREPAPGTPQWSECVSTFARALADSMLGNQQLGLLPDPNDQLTLRAWRGRTLLAEHTCRPAPEPDTPHWTSCLRAFADKLADAQAA